MKLLQNKKKQKVAMPMKRKIIEKDTDSESDDKDLF